MKKLFYLLPFLFIHCDNSIESILDRSLSCTEIFMTEYFDVKGSPLDDFFTYRTTTGDTLRLQDHDATDNEYPILNDLIQESLQGREETFIFKGSNGAASIQVNFTFTSDGCHIQKVSGPTEIEFLAEENDSAQESDPVGCTEIFLTESITVSGTLLSSYYTIRLATQDTLRNLDDSNTQDNNYPVLNDLYLDRLQIDVEEEFRFIGNRNNEQIEVDYVFTSDGCHIVKISGPDAYPVDSENATDTGSTGDDGDTVANSNTSQTSSETSEDHQSTTSEDDNSVSDTNDGSTDDAIAGCTEIFVTQNITVSGALLDHYYTLRTATQDTLILEDFYRTDNRYPVLNDLVHESLINQEENFRFMGYRGDETIAIDYVFTSDGCHIVKVSGPDTFSN